jgi:hypothetical protein
MREVFEKVLTRLVLPTNDKLVYVSVMPYGSSNNVFVVSYFGKGKISSLEFNIIKKESRSLFNMLGPTNYNELIFDYKILGEDYPSS